MAHECEDCGQQCYCDMDDCGGLEQPSDCPHFRMHEQGLNMDGSRMDDGEDYDEFWDGTNGD